jgi:hypothetical protein
MNPSRLSFFVIFIVLFHARICVAQDSFTYLNNTNAPISTNAGLFGLLGTQFQTGTNAGGYMMDGLQLLFANAEGDPSPPRFRVILLADYFNSTGLELAHLQTINNPTNAGFYNFLPDRPVELQAGTDYWILMFLYGGTSAGIYRWSFTDSDNSSSIDGWRVTGLTLPGQIGIPIFFVNATAIPEPSTFTLLLVALTTMYRKYKFSKVT